MSQGKQKGTGSRPQYDQVLARRDPGGPYERGNLYTRQPRSRRERMTGLEDLSPLEPLTIPLTDEQKAHRSSLRTKQERMMFDVFVRMLWRTQNYPL